MEQSEIQRITAPATEVPHPTCGRCEDWTTVVYKGNGISPCPACRPAEYQAWLANSASTRPTTLRTNHVDSLTVYAGSLEELAAVADEYADGRRPMPEGLNTRHLANVAEQLRAGHRVHNLGPLRFYADAADGTPFRAPYAPPPTA